MTTSAVRFDLHLLGWKGFQQLCLTVIREVLGATVQSFLPSRDAGRDGAFTGPWSEALGPGGVDGPYVVQCKHTERSGATLRVSDVRDEIDKARALVQAGQCANYILMTNAGLTARTETALSQRLGAAGVEHVLCLGADWIGDTIRDSPRLRALVPRVYGLGDLSEILDVRAASQASALLASLQEDLAKVVLTGTYERSLRTLEEHGFVLLIGEPAAGKTTIASTLAMAAIDQWRAEAIKLDEPRDLTYWNPNRRDQFLWVDDAFGVTQYEAALASSWNRVLPRVMAAVKSGTKVVLTSRDYIYNAARRDLKVSAFPLLREAQVVIDVHGLTRDEREQILYNHLRLGAQPRVFKTNIKPLLGAVASHRQFIPEIARRLAHPLFTTRLTLSAEALDDFVASPKEFLSDVLNGLDKDSLAALAMIYMAGGRLASPLALDAKRLDTLDRLDASLGGVGRALEALNDSLVRHVVLGGQPTWIFKHPTVADAFAARVIANPELLSIYLVGTPLSTVMGEISCGDVNVANSVSVPQALWHLVIERLTADLENQLQPRESLWSLRRSIDLFLAYRCDRTFLAEVLLASPETADRVSRPGMYLEAVATVPLAARLYEFGLLGESQRKAFVRTAIGHALSGDPGAFTNHHVMRLFDPEDAKDLVKTMRTRLIPELDSVLTDAFANSDEREDRYNAIRPLRQLIGVLMSRLRSQDAKTKLQGALNRIDDWVSEQDALGDDDPRLARVPTPSPNPPSRSERSIFDDIDA